MKEPSSHPVFRSSCVPTTQNNKANIDSQRANMGRIILAALAFLLVAAPIAFADTLTGKVVKVTDGDSITVLDSTNTQHRIRLQGIDAPERKQAFGNASRKHLASLVAGKTVTVKWDKRDRYGRIVGFVLVDGHDVNLEQVKTGMAWSIGIIKRS